MSDRTPRTFTPSFDPQQLFHQLEDAAEKMAETRYLANVLEKQEKVLLAQLQLEWQRSGHSVAASVTFALADSRYEKHLKGMHEAMHNANRAWSHYQNLRSYTDLLRTQEASNRHLVTNR